MAFTIILQEQHVQQVGVWAAMGSGSHFRYLAAALCGTKREEDR